MMIARRRFLSLLAAPAIVGAGSLMPVVPLDPVIHGDGIHDDTAAIQWHIDRAARRRVPFVLTGGVHRTTAPLILRGDNGLIGFTRIVGEGTIFRIPLESDGWDLTNIHAMTPTATSGATIEFIGGGGAGGGRLT